MGCMSLPAMLLLLRSTKMDDAGMELPSHDGPRVGTWGAQYVASSCGDYIGGYFFPKNDIMLP